MDLIQVDDIRVRRRCYQTDKTWPPDAESLERSGIGSQEIDDRREIDTIFRPGLCCAIDGCPVRRVWGVRRDHQPVPQSDQSFTKHRRRLEKLVFVPQFPG